MKEIIDYYYGLKIKDISEDSGIYHFFFNGDTYYFYPFNHTKEEVKMIVEIANTLANNKINSHIIIENKDYEIVTTVENVNYILIKNIHTNNNLSIVDIYDYNKKTLNMFDSFPPNWYELWTSKVDYIENSLIDISADNIIIKTIDYYLGLAENAIIYINNSYKKYSFLNKDTVLSHRRIFFPNNEKDYLNPLSFIIDVEVRDIAEYLKSLFFYGKNAFNELLTYLSLKPISPLNANLLFARLLYPTYYFDLYENWLNEKITSEKFLNIIKKQKEFENFLKKTYFELSKYAELEKIDWLIY